jgi:hypothetical protein
MPENSKVQCEYLADDQRSCSAVSESGKAASRDERCSAQAKNLCCYLCNDRESCEIGCAFLDENPEEQLAELSPTTSRNGQNTAFTCPFCGGPYQATIPSDTIQVKCGYCGARVRVPPRLGGEVQQCPNHPDTFAAGICNDCGESYCDRCLYVLDSRDARLFVCSKCYENRTRKNIVGLAVVAVLPIVLIVGSLLSMVNSQNSSSSPGMFGFALLGLLLLLVVLGGGLWSSKKKPISVHDARYSKP